MPNFIGCHVKAAEQIIASEQLCGRSTCLRLRTYEGESTTLSLQTGLDKVK
jgi:hypothetical protein